MDTPLYNWQGAEAGRANLPESLFNLPWPKALVHQVVTVQEKNERIIHAHTKTRADVRGGGKKPFPQKHTGRARHGSTRSPLWVGGGVIFGPRADRNYKRVLPKKMSTKAVFAVLSAKLRDQEFFVTNELTLPKAKTKEAQTLFEAFMKARLGADRPKSRTLIIVDDSSKNLNRAFRNLTNVRLASPGRISALLLLRHKYIILPQSSLDRLIKERGVALGVA